MAALSTYLANKLTDHSNGVTAYSMPTVYVGLTTTASTASGQGTEANYTGYARVALSSLMGAASAESASNTGAITFPACTGGSSTIVGWATFDSATAGAGNLLKFGTCSLAVSTGITPQFAVGNLTTSMS
jgi:hypothetical protein